MNENIVWINFCMNEDTVWLLMMVSDSSSLLAGVQFNAMQFNSNFVWMLLLTIYIVSKQLFKDIEMQNKNDNIWNFIYVYP